jgi:hypothetical protein
MSMGLRLRLAMMAMVAFAASGCGGGSSVFSPHASTLAAGPNSGAAGKSVASSASAGAAASTFSAPGRFGENAAAKAKAAAFVDWPTYAFDAQRSGFNPSTSAFTPSGLGALHVAWYASLQSGAQSQPIVATNVAGHAALLIVGAGNGYEIAYDGTTGAHVWSTYLGRQNDGDCGTGGVAGTAQYDVSLGSIFAVAGNSGTPNHVVLYRLSVATGSITGSVDVSKLLAGESTYGHTAVTLANGSLYFGTSSNCEAASWRGQVVAVDPNALTVTGRFFPAYGHPKHYGGGGVWSWGGASVDPSGNVYVASGNAETPQTVDSGSIEPPFFPAANEHVGYAEHVVKLSSDLKTVEGSRYPGFNFKIGFDDLDFAGTPVIFQPPGCDVLAATQGKGGKLVVADTNDLADDHFPYLLSTPSALADYVGNPAYSPVTGLLYAEIASGAGTLAPPGLAAIGSCGRSIVWTTAFGPDSFAYEASGATPRSAPTVTAGGVVFAGTPCTPDGSGGCSASGKLAGAVWAIDATTGTVLGNGLPVLSTGDVVRMAPTVDGEWMWVLDDSGNFYGLTLDPNVPSLSAKIVPRSGLRSIRWHAR